MKKIVQGVVFVALLAPAFVGFAASEVSGLWEEKDIPAWANGTFSGKAEGWLSTTAQDELAWVDANPKARVSLAISKLGVPSGQLKIGERTFDISAKGIVAPAPEDIGEDGFIDEVRFSEPEVRLNGVKANDADVEFVLENMADDYEWCHGDEGSEAPRAKISLNFSFGEDKYEVELFREFEVSEVPEAIKGLEGNWVYCGENTNKWPIVVDGFGNATLSGRTNDGLVFETASKIIDYGFGLMAGYYFECGAYFNVPATKEHEGISVWIGFSAEDLSGDSADVYAAIRDVMTSVNDENSYYLQGDGPEDEWIVVASENMGEVEVAIPQNINPKTVTFMVPLNGNRFLKANGANVRYTNGKTDITGLINTPSADEEGWIDFKQLTVREEYVREVLDPKKGAVIELNAAKPVLTTANTRAGLVYSFSEGETLDGMKVGDRKTGDGQPWTPTITVKGVNSAFYSVGVGIGK